MKENCVLVNEAKRNKFGEPSSLALDLAQQQQLIDPVLRCFHVPVHQCGRTADAAEMSRTDDLLPLRGRELVAREDVADLVVQDFGGSSGQGAEAVVAQHTQVIA